MQQLAAVFLGRHGKTEVVLAHIVETVSAQARYTQNIPMLSTSSPFYKWLHTRQWQSVSAGSAKLHLDGAHCVSFIATAAEWARAPAKTPSLREKLCIPRVRECTLPTEAASGISLAFRPLSRRSPVASLGQSLSPELISDARRSTD